MAQVIRNVKIGDRFIVNAETTGFERGVIVESISEEKNIHNKEVRGIRCKYVSGESRWKNLELWQQTMDLKKYRGDTMSQRIVNIKAGQRFIVVQNTTDGFPEGCIVEALGDSKDCGEVVSGLKWVGGYEPDDVYKQLILSHYTVDLKRYKGKIK